MNTYVVACDRDFVGDAGCLGSRGSASLEALVAIHIFNNLNYRRDPVVELIIH